MRSLEARLGGGITALLFVFIFLPLLAVIANVVFPGLFFGRLELGSAGLLLELFDRPLWKQSLLNSLLLGAGAATLGTAIGGALAIMRSQWSFAIGRYLDAAAWIVLIAPSFLLAQGWVLFAGRGGLAAELLGWDWVSAAVFQPAGLVAIMALSKFPLAYLTVRAALDWSVSQYSHAARLCGASPFTAWRTINLPLSAPAYLAGWTLVFIDTIGDFGLPAALSTVYRFPTLPYSIYTAIYQSPVRFDMAGVLAFYLVLILGVAMGLLVLAIRKSRVDFLNNRAVRTAPHKPRYSWALNLASGLVLLLCIGIPVGTSVAVSLMRRLGDGFNASNITLSHYVAVLGGAGGPGTGGNHALLPLLTGFGHSLAIAGLAALFSMLIGFAIAYVLTFTSFKFKGAIQLFSIVALAVPGVVLGIGYIFIWNQKWLEPLGLALYGKPALLVIAGIAGAIPYAVRVQLGAFANLSPSMLRAAAIQGASVWMRMGTIVVPMVRQSLLLATLAAFGTSVFDLAMASMLKPPNFALLPLVIDRAFEFSQYGYATAAAILGGGMVVVLIIALQLAGKWLFNALDSRKRKGAARIETDTGSQQHQQAVRGNESYSGPEL